MFIVIFLFFISNLCASQTLDETLAQAQADYRVNLARKKVMDVHYALVSAQLDKRSEEEIKKHEAAVTSAATDMLFWLTDGLEEVDIRLEDVDFCLAHNPEVNAIRDYESPLFSAVLNGHITLVRMLIAARANVHFTTDCAFWGEDTTLVHVAHEHENYPALAILLEAGAPLPYDYAAVDYKPVWDWEKLNEKGDLTKHRECLIDSITQANILVPNVSSTIADYAFGRAPKIDSETGDGYYSEDEVDDDGGEGDDEGDEEKS